MPAPVAHGAVIYAKNLARVSAFYAQVAELAVIDAADDHVVHQAGDYQLVVHAMPADIAATIDISDPPLRREDSAVKLVFVVPSIGRARTLSALHGGELNAPEREWQYKGCKVCDGHDPEGNVIQLREKL
jgi:predicted enzyme related to lactoylglutathione lyase